MKPWLRRSLIVLAALLLALATAFAWLVGSTAGARFALRRAIAVTEGRLDIAEVQGSLWRRLSLQRVSWKDEGVALRLARVDLDFAVLELLRRRVHITALRLDDARLVLNTVTQQPKPPRQAPISLAAPLTIRLDALHVAGGGLVKDGETLVEFDTIDLGAAWTAEGIGLKDFRLRAPAGEVDVSAQIGSAVGFPGGSEARFRWRFAERTVAGMVRTRSDGARVQVGVALSEPAALNFDLDAATRGDFAWTTRLAVPSFDPHALLPDTTLRALSLDVHGSGRGGAGRLEGALGLNGHRVQFDPLAFAYADDALRLEPLRLRSDAAPGELEARGRIALAAQPPTATLDIAWKDVVLPADLAGQALASHGQLSVTGSSADYRAQGTLSLGPPGHLAELHLDLSGTPQTVRLLDLSLLQPQGKLVASGTLTLAPRLAWDLDAAAERFDPGALRADWPGRLSFHLASRGSLDPDGPDARLRLQDLDGVLRQRPLRGQADLRLAPGYIVEGSLALASGQSTLAVTGHGGTATAADIGFTLASLGDLAPQAQGALTGRLSLSGRWPALAARGHVSGKSLAYGSQRLAALEFDADVKDLSAPSGRATLRTDQLDLGPLHIASATLQGEGDAAAHRLQLDATGDPLSLTLDLRGRREGAAWRGRVEALRLAPRALAAWQLERPAELAWREGTASLGELCLAASGPRLCLEGSQRADGSAAGRYRIEHLPLALLATVAAPGAPLKFDGEIDGEGAVTRSAAGVLGGNAALRSAGGSVAYPDTATAPLLSWRDVGLDASFAPAAQQARLYATLGERGRLDGTLAVRGATQALEGDLALHLDDLAFVELLTPAVAAVQGRLDGRWVLGGSAAAPTLSGELALGEVAAEVPAAGLKLHDGRVRVTARADGGLDVDGSLASGDGRVQLRGSAGLQASTPLDLRLEGADFLAADIPAARVVVSPALHLVRTAERTTLQGEVAVPSAQVDLSRLPGGGAARASPDVVVTDAAQTASAAPPPVYTDVTLKLGDAVKLKGFGLDGALSGQLAVSDRPGRQTTGRGEIRVSGTYKAYGQDLAIETGRLQFAGTAIDNPGLDLRAVRKLEEVTAGLRVQGTARVPVLTVYAEPPMEQAEALSYLVTGKPLSALKSGEGDMVGTAARALGSATGDLLAKSVGARLGVDAGVSDSAALGGAALTVGKYLSPRLYLSYGVGLFVPGEVITLRYLLSKRWNIDVQSATNDNRAGLNYRYEK